MKVVFPIAGRGSRFQAVVETRPEFNTAKPLILVGGQPMVLWAIQSIHRMIPFDPKDCIFVCLQEHESRYGISALLQEAIGENITIYWTPTVTDGAVATALLAAPSLDTDEDVLFMDCDHFILCDRFGAERARAIRDDISGLIPTIESTNPAWSYSQTNERGEVIRTAEKELISTHASVGMYYFTHGKDFLWAAETMIYNNRRYGPNKEFYMCPLYNELIGAGKKVKTVPADVWLSLGTPDDLDNFVSSPYARQYHPSKTL